MPAKDGVVGAVRPRGEKNRLKRKIQHLYPLEVSCEIEENAKTKFNLETPAFRPKRDAAEVAKIV